MAAQASVEYSVGGKANTKFEWSRGGPIRWRAKESFEGLVGPMYKTRVDICG